MGIEQAAKAWIRGGSIENLTEREVDAVFRYLTVNYELRYFNDLTLAKFAKSPLTWIRTTAESMTEQDEKDFESNPEEWSKRQRWITCYSDLPSIGIYGWKFTIQEFEDRSTNGKCIPEERAIAIAPWVKNRKAVLLHEMAHAYDHQLSKFPVYRDYVMVDLYKSLGEADWKRIMNYEGWVENARELRHSLLIVAKCFLLDKRCGWKPGTCLGYGREEEYERVLS